MSAIARRYARAAVVAAEDRGGAEAVEAMASGLRAFRDAFRQSAELREVVLNPAFKDNREPVLEALFEEAGATDETRNLLRLLAERERIGILDALVVEVESIGDDRTGRRRAYVSAPVKLGAAQVERIGAALEARFNCPVTVTTEVDPDMLGGLVCRVGDLTLDYSVRRQLEILREKLEEEAT